MIYVSFSEPSESVALQKNLNLWEGFGDKYLESKLWYSQSTGCPFGYIPQSLLVTHTVLLMGWLLTSLAVSSPNSLQIHVCLNALNTKFILNKDMKQALSPRDVFLGHTLFVAPPQLSSLLHCTAGFPTSTLFLPWSRPQILCVLPLSFRPVPPRDRAEHLQSSSTDLAAASKLQWPEQEGSCLLSQRRAKQPKLSPGSQLWARHIQLLYSGVIAQIHHPSSLSSMVQSIF